MTINPANAAMGPGTIYVADFGATEPAEDATGLATTPGAEWTMVGGTMGGISTTIDQDFKDLEFDQVPMPIGARKIKDRITVKFKMAEVTLNNLVLALNGGTVTPGSGYDKFVPDLTNTNGEPDYKAIIIDGTGDKGLKRRICIRKTITVDPIELMYDKDNQQVYQATYRSYYVSDTVDAYYLLGGNTGS